MFSLSENKQVQSNFRQRKSEKRTAAQEEQEMDGSSGRVRDGWQLRKSEKRTATLEERETDGSEQLKDGRQLRRSERV